MEAIVYTTKGGSTMDAIKNIIIRLETKEDYRAVENLTRESFWNVYHGQHRNGASGFFADLQRALQRVEIIWIGALSRASPLKVAGLWGNINLGACRNLFHTHNNLHATQPFLS